MAKFQYQFESLLNLREKLEDIKKREYGEALHKLEKKKEIQQQIMQSLQDNNNTLRTAVQSTIDPQKVMVYKQYHQVLEKQNIIASEGVNIATKEAEDKRIELLQALKNKKILATLKDKHREQFIEEEKKSEQQMIDQIVSFAYNDSSLNGGIR